MPVGEVGFQNTPSSPESASSTTSYSTTFQATGKAHGRTTSGIALQCDECSTHFSTKASLYHHSQTSNHSPHFCFCGKGYSRIDVLDRHIQSLNYVSTTFPCPHCKKHRGIKAFRRRDHLTQHLKGYHHMDITSDSEDDDLSQKSKKTIRRKKEKFLRCPHKDCSSSKLVVFDNSVENPEAPFHTQSQLTQHLREIHDECLFPCREDRCPRVGGRGFFRKRDLLKHMKEYHGPSPDGFFINSSSLMNGNADVAEERIQ